jgi:hypothetical protein
MTCSILPRYKVGMFFCTFLLSYYWYLVDGVDTAMLIFMGNGKLYEATSGRTV